MTSRNIVFDMMKARREALQERGQEIVDQRLGLMETSEEWGAIKQLAESEGWQHLERRATTAIEFYRAKLETAKSMDEVYTLRAQIETLRWIVRIPSLADVMLSTVEGQREALDAAEQTFIHHGA